MFKYLARNHFANKAAISQYAKEVSYYSFWMINMRSPENGWSSASCVMVNKNTVLTCAHNFNECDPELSKVVSPRTGQVLDIKTAEIDTENDLAIVTLKGKTREKTANIGREIEPEENLQVFKARMTSFNPSNGHLELVRGVLISELDTIQMNSHRNRQGSLFHMHSKPGDSGAGIFTLDGKLLALNHSGHPIKKEASGTDISVFRGLSFN